MKFSALYILPALASLLVLQGSWYVDKQNLQFRPNKSRLRIRANAWLARISIVALLAATLLTKARPEPGIPELLQGSIIALAVIIPSWIVLLLIRQLLNGREDKSFASTETAESKKQSPLPSPKQQTASSIQNRQQLQTELPTLQVPDNKSDTGDSSSAAYTHQAIVNSTESKHSEASHSDERQARANTSHKPSNHSDEETSLDQTLSVSEQLETLDDIVEFHDIGNESDPTPQNESDDDSEPAINPLEKAIAIAREAITEEPGLQDRARENLPAKSRTELSDMVIRLRSDKMKLQKLVIAQKAVIDAEKQAHNRTRGAVKDAISVMRHARHGQRVAEKVARRERAERQRIEKDFTKVQRQLDNALSTLKSNPATQPAGHS